MKNQTISMVIAVLLAVPAVSHAQSRAEALKPHLDRVWNRWADLPAQYRKQNKPTLERYLGLFTTGNGFTWNREWADFARSMGPEFAPFYADVVEAMKVAEAIEAGFPDPDDKLPQIAQAIFGHTPTNALLFVHNDVFETILLLQQQNGTRPDILLINSSRLMDQSYMKVVLDRYPQELTFKPTDISKTVFNTALRRKEQGDADFQDLRVVDGKVHADGIQLVNSLAVLMMQEISRSLPQKPAAFLPSLHKPEPVHAWRHLHSAGMFFAWQKPSRTSSPSEIIAEWQSLLDSAAPAGSPVHGEMANAIGQSVHAAAGIFDANGKKDVADNLFRIWDQRVKSVTMVSGRDIVIDEHGKMVQQDKSSVRGKPRH
jgi:hypothetical protein